MSAPVTEAHLELAKTVIFSRDSAGRLLTAPMGAQLIADSEARACAQLRAEVERLNKYSANLENDVKYLTQGVPEGDPLFLAVARAERAEAELAASRYETVKAAQDGLRECIRAERAEAALRPLVGAVESVICDTEGAVAHIFEREPGDKWRVQVALDRARQACATIPTTKGDK